MNKTLCDNWNGFSASIPGSGHIRRGLPCQDASAVVTSPRPALIVCDGRGSATRSQDGAQGAVDAFRSQIAVFDPMLTDILDGETENPEQWMMFSRIMYRTLMQVKLDLAAKHSLPEKEFDFTVAFAVIGTHFIGCFQVGDGAIVLRQNDVCQTAFPPDKGEFANQTHFLRENGETTGIFHASLFSAMENTGVAITSDGPDHLMFKLADMQPGKIFTQMMTDLHDQNLTQQDLMDYLTRRDWENDPRGADDRSIAILVPVSYPRAIITPVAETSAEDLSEAQSTELPAMSKSHSVPPVSIKQTLVRPFIDIFAKPRQPRKSAITFTCNDFTLRILCIVSGLAICMIIAIGIVLVRQMGQFKTAMAFSKQEMASIQEVASIMKDTEMKTVYSEDEAIALAKYPVSELVLSQNVAALETPNVQNETVKPPNLPDSKLDKTQEGESSTEDDMANQTVDDQNAPAKEELSSKHKKHKKTKKEQEP